MSVPPEGPPNLSRRRWLRLTAIISSVLILSVLLWQQSAADGNLSSNDSLQVKKVRATTPSVSTSTVDDNGENKQTTQSQPTTSSPIESKTIIQSSTVSATTELPLATTTTTTAAEAGTSTNTALPSSTTIIESTSTAATVATTESTSAATTSTALNSVDNNTDTQSVMRLDGFNMCREHNLKIADKGGARFYDVWFQCQGPLYDNHTTELWRWTAAFSGANNDNHNTSTRSSATTIPPASTWGRRQFSLPPNSRILLLGNGQARQMAQVLACQQSSTSGLVASHRFDRAAHRLDFAHNATLTVVVNTYAMFATGKGINTTTIPPWQIMLEEQIETKLSDFTAIVLTLVDECNRDPTAGKLNGVTTSLMALAEKWNHTIDCMTVDPPTVVDWRAVYDGPLVWASPLTTLRQSQFREEYYRLQKAVLAAEAEAEDSSQRVHGPLGFIDTRQYVMEIGQDCMAAGRTEISDCVIQSRFGNPCQGLNGGWLDMVVWDMVEFLWTGQTNTALPGQAGTALAKSSSWRDEPVVRETPTFCHSPDLKAPRDRFSDSTAIQYQCEGPLYEAFAAELMPFINNTTRHGDYWGRRSFGLPAGRKILFFGNSHTRQVAKTLACQQMEMDHIEAVKSIKDTRVHQYSMSNDASMVVVANSHAPYSIAWVRLLEEEMGLSLDSFDALVLGAFNKCTGNNTFSREMIHISEVLPDVDCLHTPTPTLTQIAMQFPGPIIRVTMFIKWSVNEESHDVMLDEIDFFRQNHNRTNIHFVDGTRYAVEMNHECRGQDRMGISDCGTGHSGSTHVCTGPHGGHADMVAYDVIELLHDEFESDKAKNDQQNSDG